MRSTTWVVLDDHGSDAVAAGLPVPDRVVCADSGVTFALRLGLHVDVVVGDLDSVPPADLDAARSAGATVEQHPAEKDATDLALALRFAARGDTDLIVLGGSGGRLDHALANVHALGDPALAGHRVWARLGAADVHVVRRTAVLDLPLGATVTLLPNGGPASGVSTEGLRYPLLAEELGPWSTRGVSNVVTGTPVHVTVDDGCLLVVVPRHQENTR